MAFYLHDGLERKGAFAYDAELLLGYLAHDVFRLAERSVRSPGWSLVVNEA